MPAASQPLHQAGGDGVVLSDDHVPSRSGADLARRAQSHPRLEPRGIEQPDEQERQHHQQEHHPRHEDDHAEQAADVGGEGDVAEPQRRHHHERPVEAGDPGVLLALDPPHDQVEEDRVDRDHHDEEAQVLEERREIGARFSLREEEAELAGQDTSWRAAYVSAARPGAVPALARGGAARRRATFTPA